jgi:hypothetical protein
MVHQLNTDDCVDWSTVTANGADSPINSIYKSSFAFACTIRKQYLLQPMAASRELSSLIPKISLNDGNQQPALGFGTYKVCCSYLYCDEQQRYF